MEGWAFTKQVADVGRGLDSVPSQSRCDSSTAPRRQAVWLSPFDTACWPVPLSAHASRPRLRPWAWQESQRGQLPCASRFQPGSAQQKGLGSRPLWPKEVFTESAESRPACAPPQRAVRTSSTPPPRLPDPRCSARTPGCTAPSSPQFPVAGAQLALGAGVPRVWYCLVICSRSGNNLKLNPQLFGSLLWNHCKFINNSCGHTWPGSQPQPHSQNGRRGVAVDLRFSVPSLREKKEMLPPSLRGHRRLAASKWVALPVPRRGEGNRLKRMFKSVTSTATHWVLRHLFYEPSACSGACCQYLMGGNLLFFLLTSCNFSSFSPIQTLLHGQSCVASLLGDTF